MTDTAMTLRTQPSAADHHGSGGHGTSSSGALSMPPPVVPLQTIADYLRVGYWNDTGRAQRSFDTSTSNVITVNITGLNADGQQLAIWALDAWEDAVNLDFQFTTSPFAQIMFSDNRASDGSATASNSSTVLGNTIIQSRVNVSDNWFGPNGTDINDYAFQTYIHEIGHAIGLGHPGNYNFNPSGPAITYANSAMFANDSWQTTVMSYFDQNENTWTNASYAQIITPMVADQIATTTMYGATSVRTGSTTYGENSNVGGYLEVAFDEIFGTTNSPDVDSTNISFTIRDDGGYDTVDFRSFAGDQVIDLRPGQYSDVYGVTGSMGIAFGTVIERAFGGSGDDTIRGNEANNSLYGLGGSDRLWGYGGNDNLYGGTGYDYLYGGTGNDNLYGDSSSLGVDSSGNYFSGSSGNDSLYGSGGNDTMYGGSDNDFIRGNGGLDFMDGQSGVDTVDFYFSQSAVNANLGTETAISDDGTETIRNFENLYGSNLHGDTLTGSADNNTIRGRGGNDIIDGVGGVNTVYGDAGADLIYSSGYGSYYGGSSNDTIHAASGSSNELLDGGSGVDTLNTTHWNGAYTINMANGQTNYGESFINFEHLISGNGNDTITGTGFGNWIRTNGGNDTINAGDGNDTLDGGLGNDALNGGAGFDIASYTGAGSAVVVNLATGAAFGGYGADTLSGIERVDGSAYGDTFYSSTAAAQTFNGNLGNDTFIKNEGTSGSYVHAFNGGGGTDTLVANGLGASHTVDLTQGRIVFGASTLRDRLISIENVTIDNGADIIGNGAANVLTATGDFANTIEGRAGNDTINAGAGNDTVSGGSGLDTLNGEAGNDTLRGGASHDTVNGGAGDDLIIIEDGEFIDTVDGGAGRDTLDLSDITGAMMVNLDTGTYRGPLLGDSARTVAGIEVVLAGSGNDTLHSDGYSRIEAGAGNDIVHMGLGNDSEYLDGGAGRDLLNTSTWNGTYTIDLQAGQTTYGAGSNETILNFEDVVTGNGNTTVLGTAGGNAITTGAGNDVVTARSGWDVVNLGDGNDTANGGAGSDRINGGNGNDTLMGGKGNDTLNGGAGDDTLTGDKGSDKLNGNAGADTLNGGDGWDTLTGGGGNDLLLGGNGNDTLSGNKGADELFGNAGRDALNGGDGWDRLFGGQGNDTLSGGKGNDRLSGDLGNDTLTGGGGNDIFVFSGDPLEGADVITDFTNGNDRIEIGGPIVFANLTIQASGADTLVSWNATSVLLEGVDSTLIGVDDFLFV